MDHEPSRRDSAAVEWVVSVTLGVLALAAFLAQVVATNAHTTGLETALFNCIQFVLTVGFAWFSTRAISQREFERSLKRFAISAYRRISDIDKLVTRLDGEVDGMLEVSGGRGSENLRIVRAIVADTAQIVRSSSADWADVIGDELIALEQIKILEREKQTLRVDPKTAAPREGIEARLSEINSQIKLLQASLPARLALDADSAAYDQYREQHAAEWLETQHLRDHGLDLKVVTGDSYGSVRSRPSLRENEQLLGILDAEGGLSIVDASGLVVGRALNNSPLDYDEFVRAVENCYGLPLRVTFVKDLGDSGYETTEITGWCSVKVTSIPHARDKASDLDLGALEA